MCIRDRGEETSSGRGLGAAFFGLFDRFYAAVDRFYRRLLSWALQNRLATVLCGLVALLTVVVVGAGRGTHIVVLGIVACFTLVGLLGGGKTGRRAMAATGLVAAGVLGLLITGVFRANLGVEFFPRVDQGQISVSVELPAGSSLEATDGVVRQLEDFLLDEGRFPDVESVYTTVGSGLGGAFGGGGTGASYGGIRVVLIDKLERDRSDLEVVEVIDRFAQTLPGAVVKTTSYQGMGGGGGAPVSIELSGSNMDELIQVAEAIRARVAQVPGTVNTDITWRVGRPEVRADIDRYRAADRGVTTFQVANALRTSLEGDTSTKYREGSFQHDVRVRLQEVDRSDVREVSDLLVGYNSGPVYLGDVAHVSLSSGPTKINRKNRQRMVAVQADLQEGYAQWNVTREITRMIEEVPTGNVLVYFGGESEMLREGFTSTFLALGLSIVLIYILQAALFEGYLTPFVIMFALPMALVGALLAIVLTGKTLSIVTMIGIIMLMGLVGKNAILLVDYTNTLRARGLGVREALLEAGPVRLRPILMTSLSLIFGLLPVAVATARGGEVRSPMAIAVIGGMALSTVLSLLVIPVLYTVFDGLAASFNRALQRLLDRAVP